MKKLFFIIFAIMPLFCLAAANDDYVTTTARLNLRSGPSTNAKIITTIPDNYTVKVIGKNNVWLKVRYNDKEGYINSKYVRVDDTPRQTNESKKRFKDYVRIKVLESKWSVLMLLIGAILIYVGFNSESAVISLFGVWIEIGYIVFAVEPLYMICPSIVGWGYTILLFLPTLIFIGLLLFLHGFLIYTVFYEFYLNSAFAKFIKILLFISCAIFIFLFVRLIITEYIALLVFVILAAVSEGKVFLGTFYGSDGTRYDVYK